MATTYGTFSVIFTATKLIKMDTTLIEKNRKLLETIVEHLTFFNEELEKENIPIRLELIFLDNNWNSFIEDTEDSE